MKPNRLRRFSRSNTPIETLKPVPTRKPLLANLYEVMLAFDQFEVELFLNQEDTITLNNKAVEAIPLPFDEQKRVLINLLKAFCKCDDTWGELESSETGGFQGVVVKCFYNESGVLCPILINEEFNPNVNTVMYTTDNSPLLYEDDSPLLNLSHLQIWDRDDLKEEPKGGDTEQYVFIHISSHLFNKYVQVSVCNESLERGFITIAVNKKTLECLCVEEPNLLVNVKVRNETLN